jgi:hypothetical protein
MKEIYCPSGFSVERGVNGRYLVTTVARYAGETLFRFLGEMVPTSEATVYALQVDEDSFLQSSPGEPSNFDDFVNHSCAPSAIVEFRDDGVYLVAMRDLGPGVEVSFDYNTTEYDMEQQSSAMGAPCVFPCDCGSPHCVGLIRGFRYLTEEQRRFRLKWLSPYLRIVYMASQ